MTTHANGPHVIAKDAMNMHADTIMTMPELVFSVGGFAVPTEANMRSQQACQIAPMVIGMRRPTLSTMYSPGNVIATFTAPRISWTKIGSSIPAESNIVAPYYRAVSRLQKVLRGCTNIEEVVDASPLLQEVYSHTEQRAIRQSWDAGWFSGKAF